MRLTDEQKAAIAEDIRRTAGTPEGSYRKIAKRNEVGVATVQKIAKDNGLADAWQAGQQQTAAATSVRLTNVAARRTELEARLVEQAHDLLDRIHDDVTHLNVVKNMGENAGESVELTVLPPGPRDWKDTMSAVGTASTKSVEIAKHNADQANTGQATSLLRDFMDGIRKRRAERDKADAGGDG